MIIDRIEAARRYGDVFVDVVMGGKAKVDISPEQDALLLLYRRVKYERFTPYSFNCMYVVEADSGAIKVGISQSPRRRFFSLASAYPGKLYFRHVVMFERGGARQAEIAVHKALADYGIRGEWFGVDLDTVVSQTHFAMGKLHIKPISLSAAWDSSGKAEAIYRSIHRGDAIKMREMTDAKAAFLWMVDQMAGDA